MTIYLHQRKNGTEKRLIKTTHPSKAMAYVSKTEFMCEAASLDTVIELVQKGIQVEDAEAKEQIPDLFNGTGGSAYQEAGGE